MEQQPGKEVEVESPPEGQVNTTTTTTTTELDTDTDMAVVEATKGIDALGVVGEAGQTTGSQAAAAAAEAVEGEGEASSSDSAGAPPCAQEQSDGRAVLQVLFEPCGGSFLRVKIAWGTAAPMMAPFGIGSSGAGADERISKLALPWNKRAGNLPSALGSLSALEELVLNDNMLTGAIPLEVCKLSGLQVLLLHNNKLAGGIPSNIGGVVIASGSP